MIVTQFSYDKNICIDIPTIKTGRCLYLVKTFYLTGSDTGDTFGDNFQMYVHVYCCMIISYRLWSTLWATGPEYFFPFRRTVYPKKYAHGFCFAVLCCGYTLTDFPISTRLTSLALWQSNDCPSASKATLMNMDKYFMWIHYDRLHNHSKAKHNKTVCIFLGVYCILNLV